MRIWVVALGEGDVEGLGDGDGDADVPARRESPPPKITPMRRSVRRPPATAARIKSIQRGPRRCGGMTLVVSDMPSNCRTPRAAPAKWAVRSLGESCSLRCRPDPRLVRFSVGDPERYAPSGDGDHRFPDGRGVADGHGDEYTGSC